MYEERDSGFKTYFERHDLTLSLRRKGLQNKQLGQRQTHLLNFNVNLYRTRAK